MTRRTMLARSVTSIAAAAVAAPLAPLFAAPAERRFKIGACDWMLRRAGPACFDVAREIGVDGVQVDMGHPADGLRLRQPDVQQAYRDAARRTGLEIASIAMGELNNTGLKSEPRAAIWLLDSIAVMKALGVNIVLVAQFFKGDLKGDKEGTDRTVELLKEIAPRAEKAGVVLGLENYLSAEENLDILRRVASPAVQVYYDVGNSTDKGYDIYSEIRMLKGHICEFHAKDGPHMLGQGRIDFAKVRAAMDEIGYRGWIQIEAAAPHNFLQDYTAQAQFLHRQFNA